MTTKNKKIEPFRQYRFIRNYFFYDSRTFGNAYRSAIKAGYSKSYARCISSRLTQDFSEKLLEEGLRNHRKT